MGECRSAYGSTEGLHGLERHGAGVWHTWGCGCMLA